MTDYTPTTEELRAGQEAHRASGTPMRLAVWLAAHDAEVRADTLRAAAEAVHAEARWQQEQKMRGAVQLSGAQTAVERLLVVEQLLQQQADHWMTEGMERR